MATSTQYLALEQFFPLIPQMLIPLTVFVIVCMIMIRVFKSNDMMV